MCVVCIAETSKHATVIHNVHRRYEIIAVSVIEHCLNFNHPIEKLFSRQLLKQQVHFGFVILLCTICRVYISVLPHRDDECQSYLRETLSIDLITNMLLHTSTYNCSLGC